jgi:hypothetical protein
MTLNIVEFIQLHPNWKETLAKKPYCVECHTSTKYPHLVLLKYNQITSDFFNPIVKECRGIILHITEETVIPVCIPFFKFGNYGEGYADKIDWDTARVQEKIDGSILKIWYYFETHQWMLSTNGTIDASDAKSPFVINGVNTFADIFSNATHKTPHEFAEYYHLDQNKTYMFEITGPYNKIVIQYPLDIYQIGVRHNQTYIEEQCVLPIKKPKEFKFSSLEETIEFSKTLSSQEEGFVVVDDRWNRVKIKGVAYVQLHHLRGEVVTPKRMLSLVLANEGGEFLNYFPEFTGFFEEIQDKFHKYMQQLIQQLDDMDIVKTQVRDGTKTRKDYADLANKTINKALMFDLFSDKFEKSHIKEYIKAKYPPEKIIEWLK